MKKILVIIAIFFAAYSAKAQRTLQLNDGATETIITAGSTPGSYSLPGGNGEVVTLGGTPLKTSGYLLIADGTTQFKSAALSGDASITSAGVLTLGRINNKVLDGSVLAPADKSIFMYDAAANAGAGAWVARLFSSAVTVNATNGAVSLADNIVSFAKVQAATAESVLIGRGQGGGAGNFQEITIGSGLTMTGTVLSNSGAGGTSFADNVFEITDNTTPTKKATFQASGITAATTRVYTFPDADGTLTLGSAGTTNTVPKWSSATTIGNSSITDNGTTVSTTGNLSTAGDLSLTGSNEQLSFKGNSTGVSTFAAGAQGATNINYTLPTAGPTSDGQFLASTTSGGMSWTAQKVVWSGHATNVANNGTEYACVSGMSTATGTEADFAVLVPFACTITGLYVEIENQPGGTDTWDFNVRKRSGATTTDATSIQLTGTTTAGNVSFTMSVAAGERIVFRSVPANTPAAPGNVFYGIVATVP